MEMKFWSMMVLGLVFTAAMSSAALADGITCPDAIKDVLPCKQFLVGEGPATPPITCCVGVEEVYKAASTKEIRQTLCECFKKAAAGLPLSQERLKELPDLCHVALPVPLDPHIDCSKVPMA